MAKIHVLAELVVNKIAAGEVIERPASIVKELVENALDAGATSVEVSVKSGGRSFIRVADNGSGMNAEDAELAFQRHATSKLSTAEDLEAIASFGFRGEALPSIAAVSRVKMQTRLRGSQTGTEIVIEGGKLLSAKPANTREGTIMEVRDLFFNTPARRKFVKTDSTELGHITDIVTYLALANISVRFILESNDKTLLDLVPASSILERAAAIWPEEAKQLIAMDANGEAIRVHGVIGKPMIARANRSGQMLFVNRRWIRSVGLGYALQEGYHGLLMHGQFAFGILFVEADPARVDVNVHPTKQEVRISHENEIKSLIRRTVAEALQKDGALAPDLKSTLPPGMNFPKPSYTSAPYFQIPPANTPASGLKVAEPAGVEEAAFAYAQTRPQETSALAQPISFRDKLFITKVLGQIHHTFIIAETEDGMIVVDQHAAHERVMFEVMLAQLKSGNPQKQGFLMDEILEISPKHEEVFKESLGFFEKIGFEIEPFGERSYVIRAYPAILSEENPLVSIKEYLEEKEDGKTQGGLDHQEEEVAAMIACKRKSVKAHDPMTAVAMQALLERLARCENPFNCPHGRPTFFKYTFSDLEKQFKRK